MNTNLTKQNEMVPSKNQNSKNTNEQEIQDKEQEIFEHQQEMQELEDNQDQNYEIQQNIIPKQRTLIFDARSAILRNMDAIDVENDLLGNKEMDYEEINNAIEDVIKTLEENSFYISDQVEDFSEDQNNPDDSPVSPFPR